MTPQEQDFCIALLPKQYKEDYSEIEIIEMLAKSTLHFEGKEMIVVHHNGKRDVFELGYIPQLKHIS